MSDSADLRALVRLGEAVDAREADDWFVLTSLGAAHYRLGRWEDAVGRCEAACKAHGGGGNAFCWFFLAMAHQRLGHADDARRWLAKAVRWAESAAEGTVTDAFHTIPLGWQDQVILDLLRGQAEALIRAR